MKKLLLSAALVFAVSGCATPAKETATEPAQSTATTEGSQGIMATCPVACMSMHCPPPGGTIKKCCPISPYSQTCS